MINREQVPQFSRLFLPMDQPSLLSGIAESKRSYLGPPANTAQNITLRKWFGRKAPANVLLLLVRGRTRSGNRNAEDCILNRAWRMAYDPIFQG